MFEDCRKCDLWKTRTHVVVGRGNPDAKIWFIGEAPGKQEDIMGVPFVGAAGNELNKAIAKLGLNKDDYYVTNSVLCRPVDAKGGNRAPTPEEKSACEPNRRELLATYQPSIVVTLGKHAAEVMLGDLFVSYETGVLWDFMAYKIFTVLHPASILYNPQLRNLWNDNIEKLRAVLNEQNLL